jgi:glutathione S-transferase
VLPESVVIDEYLEERFPEPPLLPPDPGERAVARLLVFRFDDLGKPYYALRRGADDAHERLDDVLTGLDRTLSAMPFLTGRSFGLADVAYVPWLLRLRDLMGFSLDGYATLTAWIERCSERPSVAAEVETVASLAV